MYKTLLLIVNPAAGRGAYKTNFGEAMQLLSNSGYIVTLFFTAKKNDALHITQKYASSFDVISCIGGDGTLSEILAGLMPLKDPPPVGYFPMGTANDIATTLGLPKNDIVSAAKRIISGTPHDYDVGKFGNNDYFAYIAAFGAFTEVSYATPQDQKKVLGHLAYVLQGMQQLPKIEPIHVRVEYDSGVFDGNLLYGSVSNSTSVAGIVHLPDTMVSLGDGISELVLLRDPGNVADFAEILSSVIYERYDSDKLLIIHTKKAHFYFDLPVAWTRDGESGGQYTEVEIQNIQCPVKLIF